MVWSLVYVCESDITCSHTVSLHWTREGALEAAYVDQYDEWSEERVPFRLKEDVRGIEVWRQEGTAWVYTYRVDEVPIPEGVAVPWVALGVAEEA